jgi:hypothetical protein
VRAGPANATTGGSYITEMLSLAHYRDWFTIFGLMVCAPIVLTLLLGMYLGWW